MHLLKYSNLRLHQADEKDASVSRLTMENHLVAWCSFHLKRAPFSSGISTQFYLKGLGEDQRPHSLSSSFCAQCCDKFPKAVPPVFTSLMNNPSSTQSRVSSGRQRSSRLITTHIPKTHTHSHTQTHTHALSLQLLTNCSVPALVLGAGIKSWIEQGPCF